MCQFSSTDADIVVEYIGGGVDTVLALASHVLSASAEIEVLRSYDAAATTALNLTGSVTANAITGNAGANVLAGLAGNDALFGLSGGDVLKGGARQGHAHRRRGQGRLRVRCRARLRRMSTCSRTSPSRTIPFWLDNAVMKAIGKNGKLAKDAFFAGKKAHDAEDRIVYDSASGNLFYDADGSGKIAAIKLAVLANKAKLALADFLVI